MSTLLPLAPIVDARTANLFLFGLIFNQNQKSDRAFSSPQELEKRLGGIEPEVLVELDQSVLTTIIAQKPALHPFASTMAKNLIYTSRTLLAQYNSDARNVWEGEEYQKIMKNLIGFQGIGEKKALVGTFLLANHFSIIQPDESLNAMVAGSCPGVYYRYLL